MKTKQVLQIILPNIQAMMTGVWRIQRAHDLVTLEYTDGQREAAMIPLSRWSEIHQDPFAIVGEVQSKRTVYRMEHAALNFTCNCSGGETRRIDATHLEHKCGHRPSASYGSDGTWKPYVADKLGRWWVDWKSTPLRA